MALDEIIRAGSLLAEDRPALVELAESQARQACTDISSAEVVP